MANEQKIEKCPMPECGGECDVYQQYEGHHVHCPVCKASSATKPTEAEAIAAHNRVSNAVATQPDLLDALDELLALWRCDPGDSAERNIVEAAIRKTKEKSDG